MDILLRGHHLLCLLGFQGYGYDENFIKNMNSINSKIKNKNTHIILTNKKDDICKKCPNLKNNLCQNQKENKKIVSMDDEILSKIKYRYYKSEELIEIIQNIFNTKKSVSKICYNCIWHEKCLFYQNLENR